MFDTFDEATKKAVEGDVKSRLFKEIIQKS
jgi:hypothetical protein